MSLPRIRPPSLTSSLICRRPGNITDKDAYKGPLRPRGQASTYVDNGITVPHRPHSLRDPPQHGGAAAEHPGQYNADDDGKTDLLFAIAAPENGSLR